MATRPIHRKNRHPARRTNERIYSLQSRARARDVERRERVGAERLRQSDAAALFVDDDDDGLDPYGSG